MTSSRMDCLTVASCGRQGPMNPRLTVCRARVKLVFTETEREKKNVSILKRTDTQTHTHTIREKNACLFWLEGGKVMWKTKWFK